nr:unnamed protein product [Callosobruchus analis]
MAATCEICEKIFTLNKNLTRQLREIHGVEQKSSLTYPFETYSNKCYEGCNLTFFTIGQLKDHLVNRHDFTFGEGQLNFKCYEEFQTWLEGISCTQSVQYIKQAQHKKLSLNEEVVYFYCNRSGKKTEKPDRKRKIKTQGTCKLNMACTSTVTFTICKDTNRIRTLAPPKARSISYSYQIKYWSPLLKGNYSVRNLKKTDLLTPVDVNNIKKSFNIDIRNGVRHACDVTSVELWIKEFNVKERNTVIYKKQGDDREFLNKDVFCLIFMNPSQEYMLKKFGVNGIICIDSTHGLNQYDF